MKSRPVLAAALVLAASAASAQSLKPGLWEISHKMQTSGNAKGQDAMAQMNQQMATMPPEQRKKIEEMMAKDGARTGSGSPGGGMSVQDLHDQGDGRAQRAAVAAGRLQDHPAIAQRQHHEDGVQLQQAAVQRRRPGDLRESGGLQHRRW